MNLKEIRVSRRLKVQEVSDYLSCLPSVYSRYENGKREPSIDILLKLSKLYSVCFIRRVSGREEYSSILVS